MSSAEQNRPVGRLVLEDGSIFRGRAFGACDNPFSQTGEVVFNTAMTGYQECLTDPSYTGQILTMTAPMIGNYGISALDVESDKPHIAGFIIRELSRIPSNYRSEIDLSTWLAKAGILALEGIDTRTLVRKLRTTGAMRGVISCDQSKTDEELLKMTRSSPSMAGCNLACEVSPKVESDWSEDMGDWQPASCVVEQDVGSRFKVVALDCGAKRNIYRNLAQRGCDVHVVPYDTPVEKIISMKPDGLFVTNGPGDPDAVDSVVETLKKLAGKIPTFGICLGHQLLALTFGAKTFKLKFGHRGANQPVRNLLSGQIEITSQNHGFCVDQGFLEESGCEMTHIHLNDNTLSGFRHKTLPVFSVQYHPEASPGPHDSDYLFDCFIEMMRTGLPVSTEQISVHNSG